MCCFGKYCGLGLVPQKCFCLCFRGWASSGLSAQEQAPKRIKLQEERSIYKARKSKSRFNLELSLRLQRSLPGRAPAEESGKIVLSLKSTAGL